MRTATERPTFPTVGRPTTGRSSAIVALLAILVIDGDTVEQDGQRWRLAGIDAPEIHRARCPAERRAGIIGAARLIALLDAHGGTLTPLVNGRGTIQRDKFGRVLGTLTLGDGRAWSDIARDEGHAVAWDGKGRQPNWCGPTS